MPQRTRYCSRCLTTFTQDVDRCPNLSCSAVRPQAGWGELMEEGETIDRTYRIRQRLAIGGAGVTYLAREIGPRGDEVGPLVAVKVLYQQRDQGPYLRRLATEAQILQGLNHAQIVECRGFVHRTGHSPYLVTRFEAGGSLLDHVRKVGTLSIPVTANIGRQVCWALEVAHRQHVVHRDLKPENVLLVKQVSAEAIPDLKVADFGIAKVMGGVGDRLTRAGAFIGTPQYASPEQFEGLTPEPAADIYALGAMLYFCMTGRPVADFMGELDPDEMRDHLIRHLPVRLDDLSAPPHLRRWMEDTLALAMSVEPGDRCSLATLDRRLADIAGERDPGHVPVATPRDLPTSSPTLSAGMLEALATGPGLPPGPTTDERKNPSPPKPTVYRSNGSSPPDVVFPDPAAGTADPVDEPPLPIVNVPDPVPKRAVPVLAPVPAPDPAVEPAPEPFAAIAPATEPLAAIAPAIAPVAATEPKNEPAPAAGPSPFPEEPAPKRSGCWVMTLALVTGLVLFAGLAGLALWFAFGNAPERLTGKETDAATHRDWELVASAMGPIGVQAERACKAPPYLAIEATVLADGKVSRVDLLNYDHEPTRACIEQQFAAQTLPRNRAVPVRVAVTLQE